MQITHRFRTISAVAALALAAVRAPADQNAKTIVDKANAIITGAQTYQSISRMDIVFGALGTAALDVDLKMIPNKKASVKTSEAKDVKPSGQLASLSSSLFSQQVVDDGKNTWAYNPVFNKYYKGPHGSGTQGMGLFATMLEAEKGEYKLLPSIKIEGRPMYAIAFKPEKNNGTAMVIYVDKATYHVKRIQVKIGVQGQNMSMVMTTKSEKLNAPIPASVFMFTPPPGATLMQGSPAGMMGGLGGMQPGQ